MGIAQVRELGEKVGVAEPDGDIVRRLVVDGLVRDRRLGIDVQSEMSATGSKATPAKSTPKAPKLPPPKVPHVYVERGLTGGTVEKGPPGGK